MHVYWLGQVQAASLRLTNFVYPTEFPVEDSLAPSCKFLRNRLTVRSLRKKKCYERGRTSEPCRIHGSACISKSKIYWRKDSGFPQHQLYSQEL
ncbi:hypothetical protein M413DRAFT_182719 [Hebeloma cylindrosporum]|uniref:Uncharacterized protein n=1 Tax=Hebeloma cylindrosporum TaxID=76867 RepID=A0A0C2YFE6_HEBCY|nr:hypothetical protein M413DRAFT_182719 [Hebeloma cylindrosporum h7]